MMGTASAVLGCGCHRTRLMEPDADIWIEYVVCTKHYRGTEDDQLITEAATNNRVYRAMIEDPDKNLEAFRSMIRAASARRI